MEKPYEDTLAGIPVKPSLLGNNTSDNFHPQLLSACQRLQVPWRRDQLFSLSLVLPNF